MDKLTSLIIEATKCNGVVTCEDSGDIIFLAQFKSHLNAVIFKRFCESNLVICSEGDNKLQVFFTIKF